MDSRSATGFNPSHDEYKAFFSILEELRAKKTTLDTEVALIQKERNTNKPDSPSILLTEKKHRTLSKLLNDIEEDISVFNESNNKDIAEKDKNAGFWFILKLTSRVMHIMVEDMHILLGYRDIPKSMLVGITPSFCLAGLAFFALPAAPYIAAAVALIGGLQFTAAFGFSQTANYVAFPYSFRLVTRLANELKKTLYQMIEHTSLPENYSIEASYKLLNLDNTVSVEKINERLQELQTVFGKELYEVNRIDSTIDNRDIRRQIFANKMVETMRAGILVTVDKNNPRQVHASHKLS